MAGADTAIAIVAFIVSIVALIVTVSQLLAQLFETAEGRVKCSKEVMGSWGALTKVKMHWWQLRFETRFFSPELIVSDISDREEPDFDRLKQGWLRKCGQYRRPRDAFQQKSDLLSENEDSDEHGNYGSFLLGPKYHLLQSALQLPDYDITDGWQAFMYQLQSSFTSFLDTDSVYGNHGDPSRFGRKDKDSAEEKPERSTTKLSIRHRFVPLSYLRVRILGSWHYVAQRLRALDDEGLRTLWSRQLELGVKSQTTRTSTPECHNPKPHVQWPAIVVREWRWDLFPPDISKPIASTRLYDLAVIAHRIGMVWKQFDPAVASGLQADSDSHMLNLLEIRGLGIGVHYRLLHHHRKNDVLARTADTIPLMKVNDFKMLCFSDLANAYLFRIAHGDSDLLKRYTFNINGAAEVANVWSHTFGFSEERDWNKLFRERSFGYYKARRAAHELIHLSAPFFRQQGSGIALLPIHWHGRSAFGFSPCRKAFVAHLRDEISSGHIVSTNHLQKMLDGAQALAKDLPKDEQDAKKLLDDVHKLFIETITWFKDRGRGFYVDSGLEEDRECNHFYFNILRAHLLWCPDHRPVAESIAKDFKRGDEYAKKIPRGREFCKLDLWHGELAHQMFDSRGKYIDFMEEKAFSDFHVVEEAWITMMIRGFCWGFCHQEDQIQNKFLPAQHYGSQMPVYLP